MTVTTYEGIVQNGCVHLPVDVMLPENSKVYVIVPGTEVPRTAHIRSPRLADPSRAPFFKLEVTKEETDA